MSMTATDSPMSSSMDRHIESRSSTEDSSGTSRFQRRICSPFALFLVWAPIAVLLVLAVVAHSLVAYLADDRPETALKLQPTYPTALLNLAEDTLFGERSKPDSSAASDIDTENRSKVRQWTKLALRQDPLNARGFGILGHLSRGDGNKSQTEAFMRAAAHRSMHESEAVYWMMVNSYFNEDYPAAIRYGETLLRTRARVEILRAAVPVLAKIAELHDARDKLVKVLGENPRWRRDFFRLLPKYIQDARTPLELFLRLKDTPNPPAVEEINWYLKFLISRKFYDVAYYAWLQFLPEDQLGETAYVYNGDFEAQPSGAPFDWQFPKKSGATIDIVAPDEESGRALFVKFGPGRVDFGGVTQLLLLSPGNYEFRGRRKADVVSSKGLRWHVSCAGSEDKRLGESELITGRDGDWVDFAFSFPVSKSECPAQYLRFGSEAQSASEQFISGSLWLDDIQIRREPAVTP